MIDPPPPDFSEWILKAKLSLLIFKGEGTKLYTRPVSQSDALEGLWLGYSYLFESKDGIACCKAHEIFGKETIVKIWRLKEDEADNFSFSISNTKGSWRWFSNRRHSLRFVCHFQKPQNPGTVLALTVSAVFNSSQERAFEVYIPRY